MGVATGSTSSERGTQRGSRNGALFAIAVAALTISSLLAGAALRPALERLRPRRTPSPGELALLLEHAAVDVRLGRAGPLAPALAELAGRVTEPTAKERVLALWAESALQAGRYADAEAAERLREALVSDAAARDSIRLRRIGLAAALGRQDLATELAKPLLDGEDPARADDARLRLVGAMTRDELRAWVESQSPRDAEDARRAGLAALRLLGDAAQAERLLAPLEAAGQRDAGMYQALGEAYAKLERPRDVARVAAALARQSPRQGERERLAMVQADALARAGDAAAALAAVEPLRRSPDRDTRQAARRARYEFLRQSGRLDEETRSLRDPGERAFVALEVQRDYAQAARLYGEASRAHPDSIECAEGLREAERRRDLAERRSLYEQVLGKDPGDSATREKLLSVLVSLQEGEAVRKWVSEALRGRESAPDALLATAVALQRAGLARDAAGLLEKAHAAERDTARKQQILFALGDLYAEARQENEARRLYAGLAAGGESAAIRERAVTRLAALLR